MTEKPKSNPEDMLATGGAFRGALGRDLVSSLEQGETWTLDRFRPGEQVGRYRIERLLGEGGMGQVFEAFDVELERRVAIKLLSPGLARNEEAQQRFHREARSVSALSHPNICVLFDAGHIDDRSYLIFELVEGQTLKEILDERDLSVDEALGVAIDIADALDCAHQHGILHRDIKPGNVILTADGRVKLLDFGIAKELSPTSDRDVAGDARDLNLTATGRAVGTVAYMSPEQVRGTFVDERSDIFSLGALLYELLTGRKAFPGATAGASIEAVLRFQPPSLRKMGHLVAVHRLVFKAIQKEPNDRFASSDEFSMAARKAREEVLSSAVEQPSKRWAAGILVALGLVGVLAAIWLWKELKPQAAKPTAPQEVNAASIAVLSFDDSGVPDGDFLEVAVPDEILSVFMRTKELAVRPFSESSRFAFGTQSAVTIGEELGAEVLVGGRIENRSGRTLISLEAIRAEDGALLWRQSLTSNSEDRLGLKKSVTDAVKQGLLPILGTEVVTASSGASNEEAYRLYIEARKLPVDPEPNRRSIELLRQAVRLDPTFASAWLLLGQRLDSMSFYFDSERHAETAQAFTEAVRLEPNLIEADQYLVLDLLERGHLLDAHRRALALSQRRPELAAFHIPLGLVYRYAGLLELSVQKCDAAAELDPLEPELRQCVLTYLFSEDYARAEAVLGRSRSELFLSEIMARADLMRGQRESALQRWQAQSDPNAGVLRRDRYAQCLGQSEGRHPTQLSAELEQILGMADGEWKFYSAGLFAECGEKEASLELLSAALDSNYCVDPSGSVDPLLAALDDGGQLDDLQDRARVCREQFLEQSASDARTAQN